MFQKIKYWFINLYLAYTKIQQGILQYRACNYCGKKYWFEIVTCNCGECDNEITCVCSKCDKEN